MSNLVFITGPTGALGRPLVKEYIRRGRKVALLVRPGANGDAPEERVRDFLGEYDPKQVIIVEGDVEQQDLGIKDSRKLEVLLDGALEINHLAAKTDLSGAPDAEDDTYRCNVGGVRNVLNFGRTAGKKLELFVYVSTAFVGGYSERLDEVHPLEPKHRNSYETSKYKGEELIIEFIEREGGPAIIIRPSIIVADYFPRMSGLNVYKPLFAGKRIKEKVLEEHAKQHNGDLPKGVIAISCDLFGEEGTGLNLIDVNDVVYMAVEIPERVRQNRDEYLGPGGKYIFNLVNGSCISVGEVWEVICKCLGISGVGFTTDLAKMDKDKNAKSKYLYKAMAELRPYMQGKATEFGNENVQRILPGYKVPLVSKELLAERFELALRSLNG